MQKGHWDDVCFNPGGALMQSPYPLAIKHGNGWKQMPVMDDFPIIHTYIYIIYTHTYINIYIYTQIKPLSSGIFQGKKMLSVAITGTGCGASENESQFWAPKPKPWKFQRWRPGNYPLVI